MGGIGAQVGVRLADSLFADSLALPRTLDSAIIQALTKHPRHLGLLYGRGVLLPET